MEEETQTPSTEEAAQSTEASSEQSTQTTTYVNGKYDSVGALEDAYTNLHQKFGSFTGAPEAYEMGADVEYNAEHPLFTQLQEYGKANNLSNEGYQNLVNVMLENEKNTQLEMQQQAEEVMKNLGENADARVKNVDDFLNANMEMDESMIGLIDQAKTMPGGVELIEKFIGLSKGSTPANEQVTPAKAYTQDELNNLQFAEDRYGERKMSSDPAYRKMVNEYRANLLNIG